EGDYYDGPQGLLELLAAMATGAVFVGFFLKGTGALIAHMGGAILIMIFANLVGVDPMANATIALACMAGAGIFVLKSKSGNKLLFPWLLYSARFCIAVGMVAIMSVGW
ncbi:MAG: hypothetical protein NTV81_04330, partial [Candidatus Komeilibacteria bacterium]|nr:hypothetical protein [Candidatus Komeilibacteria bacterium]